MLGRLEEPMFHRICVRAFALGVCLAVSGLAVAAPSNAQARVEEKVNIVATGEITSLDAEKRMITVDSTNDDGVVYEVEGAASIMADGGELTLEDLQVGWHVAVNGHEAGGKRIVTFIKVVKKP